MSQARRRLAEALRGFWLARLLVVSRRMPGSLELLRRRLVMCAVVVGALVPSSAFAQANVTTHHNDAARTGPEPGDAGHPCVAAVPVNDRQESGL